MSSADGSVLLTAEQAKELHKVLSHCRHEVNGCLSLIMSAMERPSLKQGMTTATEGVKDNALTLRQRGQTAKPELRWLPKSPCTADAPATTVFGRD